MNRHVLKEIIPITKNDCYTVFSRVKTEFDFPLHYHEEYEINMILNARGAQRVVGDHISEIEDVELALIGPNIPHGWFTHNCKSKNIIEVTIQFHNDLFDDRFLKRNQLSFIRKMFAQSSKGILFSEATTRQLSERIIHLNKKHGFDGVLELMSVLHDLSVSRNMQLLSGGTQYNATANAYTSSRVVKTMEYLNQNFDKPVTLAEVAKLSNMSESSFSRFFKAKTGMNFIDSLNEIRLGQACRLLIETSDNISEIAYHCGFNNLANFNRIFKSKKGCTPNEFRESYSRSQGIRVFI